MGQCTCQCDFCEVDIHCSVNLCTLTDYELIPPCIGFKEKIKYELKFFFFKLFFRDGEKLKRCSRCKYHYTLSSLLCCIGCGSWEKRYLTNRDNDDTISDVTDN